MLRRIFLSVSLTNLSYLLIPVEIVLPVCFATLAVLLITLPNLSYVLIPVEIVLPRLPLLKAFFKSFGFFLNSLVSNAN